jgi:uncharacterized protein YyaL (SSP411 family)
MPRFGAAATTMAALAFVFSAAAWLRGRIGPPEEGPLGAFSAGYLRQGARLPVRWRVLSDSPFLEAQRLDRPVVVVAGAERSALARAFDRRILALPEVAERLNREFVSVRVDLDQRPEWASSVLPLSGAAANFDETWFVACFDPAGTLLGYLARTSGGEPVDEPEFLAFLTEARRLRAGDPDVVPPLEQAQGRERRLLIAGAYGSAETPYSERLRARLDPAGGLLRSRGSRRLWPWEWRYLVRLGDLASVTSSLEAATKGPMMDWTGPGVYRLSVDGAGKTPSFVRDAVLDADFAAAMAEWAAATGDAWPREVALQVVQGISETFVAADAVYGSAWREVPESLVAPARLVRVQAVVDRHGRAKGGAAVRELGIDRRTNPSCVPLVRRPFEAMADWPAFRRKVALLEDSTAAPLQRGTTGYLDVTAGVGARMLEVGRLLGSEQARSLGLQLYDRCRALRVGPDDVIRTRDTGGGRSRTLVEYVAYAEVALEAYLATGEVEALDEATAVFERATTLFQGSGQGALRMVSDKVAQPFTPELPSLADGDRRGVVGAVVQASWRLSCAWRGTPRGERLREYALRVASAYEGAAGQLGFRVGSFELARLEAQRDEFVVVVGRGAVARARALGPALRGVLVVPATREDRYPVQSVGAWRFREGMAPERVAETGSAP